MLVTSSQYSVNNVSCFASREPQKCYCATAVCRGWLGEPPDELTREEKEEERKRNALTAISDKPVDKRKKEDKKQQFDDEVSAEWVFGFRRKVGLFELRKSGFATYFLSM